MAVADYVKMGRKIAFNEASPEFGLKGYRITNTTQYEPVYKIPAICIPKKDKADHYTDLEIKRTKGFPGAKYDMIKDWTKTDKGKWLKGKRVTSTEEMMMLIKKRNVPGPIYKMPSGVGDQPHHDKMCD